MQLNHVITVYRQVRYNNWYGQWIPRTQFSCPYTDTMCGHYLIILGQLNQDPTFSHFTVDVYSLEFYLWHNLINYLTDDS